ncbi:MAG: enoyl-CoA hydratase/isomerase family protein [Acidimicrobiales bacterium]|nr:enoyl-CoA hydratase/isomerase family protein [Acidimicrobiales bacterium]MXX42388.1 enoyl-CoA hydratase/isomerase family protein [Acidimicrobiales bacterium]MYD33175.1 enoyl-CoA hydratase/isomerase family protein [Acidimicrobiales bacterium]MYI10189.1 enoyl-CoA hydratase/isomerase family protein [Acidimicrobiales bacterium]MYI13124.1 enoyl-CoA hydratase/isomerase family protein [Acidimicrobiales bacterium]
MEEVRGSIPLSSTRRTCQEFPVLRGSASVGQTWLMSDHVRLEIDGAVAVVTMAKPPHNLLNGAFIDQLIQAFESAADAGGRAILLRSDMKHFSAGADVDGFGSEEGRSQDAAAVLERLEGVPLPTIAAVHGLALGGGFEVALACDFIICGASARLGLVEATLGLMPLLGGVQRVVDRAGASRGKEIAMFARRHDPVLLEKWGIVNVVVEDDELENAALSWARQLATGPNVSYAAIKRLAAITTSDGVRAADAVQDEAAKPVWASEDLQTGMTAYAETGPGTAIFQGR